MASFGDIPSTGVKHCFSERIPWMLRLYLSWRRSGIVSWHLGLNAFLLSFHYHSVGQGMDRCLLFPRQMTFVLYASNSELKNVTTQLINNSYPDRIQILIMAHRRKTSFPINFLRNLGIAITTTSHFIVMDMDMWPARMTSGWCNKQQICIMN